jgi:hypothetical protein
MTEFYEDTGKRDGHQAHCKACTHDRVKVLKAADRESWKMQPRRLGPSVCPLCDTAIRNGTDGDGVLVIWCACDHGTYRVAPVYRPANFVRYDAGATRQAYLEERFAMAVRPPQASLNRRGHEMPALLPCPPAREAAY